MLSQARRSEPVIVYHRAQVPVVRSIVGAGAGTAAGRAGELVLDRDGRDAKRMLKKAEKALRKTSRHNKWAQEYLTKSRSIRECAAIEF